MHGHRRVTVVDELYTVSHSHLVASMIAYQSKLADMLTPPKLFGSLSLLCFGRSQLWQGLYQIQEVELETYCLIDSQPCDGINCMCDFDDCVFLRGRSVAEKKTEDMVHAIPMG